MRCVISTVGTSLFENQAVVNAAIKNAYSAVSKVRFSERTQYQDECDLLKNQFPEKISDIEACAEIKSLEKIAALSDENIEIHFLCSDTLASNLAAEIIKDRYQAEKFSYADIHVVKGLAADDSGDFESTGMNEIVAEVNRILKRYEAISKDNGEEPKIVLNITGGYKGAIPFLTLLGQIKQIPIYYIFENTESLIKIPQLPVLFDSVFIEKYYYDVYYPKKAGEDSLELLTSLGFLTRHRKKTALGEIFLNAVEEHYSAAKNVFGFLIEHKLFEYFQDKIPSGYNNISHSEETLNLLENDGKFPVKGGEIDILFSKKKGLIDKNKKIILDNKFISVEVKSDYQFSIGKSKLLAQFEEKLKLFCKHEIFPEEIWFVIHSPFKGFFSSGFNENPEIIDTYEQLKSKIKTYGLKSHLKIIYCFTQLHPDPRNKTKNEYNVFMQKKFTQRDFKIVFN